MITIRKIIPFKFFTSQALLIGLYVLAVIIINPFGDFPLNDDWAYAKITQILTQTGYLKINDWPAMTLVSQIVPASLFCKVAGFSFFNLRLLTLLSSLISVLLMYQILLKLCHKTLPSFFITLVLSCNPIYICLSSTFMTEIYFITYSLLAIYFFIQYETKKHLLLLLLTTLFCIAVVLERQTGLIIPFSIIFVPIFSKKLKINHIVFYFLPFILSLASLIIYTSWLNKSGQMYPSFGKFSSLISSVTEMNAKFFIQRTGLVMIYLGVFTIPLAVLFSPTKVPAFTLKKWILFFLVSTVLLAIFISSAKLFPYGNIFYNLGLGPKLLKDAVFGLNIQPQTGRFVFTIIISLSALSIIIFTLFVFQNSQNKEIGNFLSLFVIAIIGMISFLIINPIFFDRYVLPLLVLLLPLSILFIPQIPKSRFIISSIFLAVFFFTGCFLTHDYLSWNRARWTALNDLQMKNGASPNDIDGGFEFNGWYQAHPYRRSYTIFDKSWWFVDEDYFVISLGPISGYSILSNYPFLTYLPPKKENIYILKKRTSKINFDAKDTIICNCEERTPDRSQFYSEGNRYKLKWGQLQTNCKSHSGKFAIQLSPEFQFGLEIKFYSLKPGEIFRISVYRYGHDKQAGIALSITDSKFFKHITTSKEIYDDGWEKIEITQIIPPEFSGREIGIFLYNAGSNHVIFDDLKIIRVKP